MSPHSRPFRGDAMKIAFASRHRRGSLRKSREGRRIRGLCRRLRRLTLEPPEDRCLLSVAAELERFSLSPALFVENHGQCADESVRFVHYGDRVSVAMTDAGPVFQEFRRTVRRAIPRLQEHYGGAAGRASVGVPPGSPAHQRRTIPFNCCGLLREMNHASRPSFH